jgi:translation elongation factor EF-G
MTGFCVNLVAAKWHDVHSHAGAFKRVAREAMEHIFTEAARK